MPKEFRQARDLFEAQHFFVVHAQFACYVVFVPTRLQQGDDNVGHGHHPMHAACAVVPDGRRDAILDIAAVAADRHNRQIAVQALADAARFFTYALAVKAIDNQVLFRRTGLMRHDRLRIAVCRDGKFQQLHLGRRNGIGVVVVTLHRVGRHPLHTIDGLVGKGAVLMQVFANLIERFDALRQRQIVEFAKQRLGPIRQIGYVRHTQVSLK